MVRVKPFPSRSAPKTSTENWNGTLFILNNPPHFDLEDEPTAPSPTETPSPTPTALSSSSDKRYLPWVRPQRSHFRWAYFLFHFPNLVMACDEFGETV
jgi:hypothetical protein